MQATTDQNRPHIYLVDDDEDDQFLVQRLIRQHRPAATVEVLGDGEALIQALACAQALPALVLLDLNMPRMSGLEALSCIRANRIYDALPIVILTTSESDQDRQQALALQATDYLIKPATYRQADQLVSAITHHWL
ncbi:response regulator (plasmid) [Fibrella sp. ES10-3-2-2]